MTARKSVPREELERVGREMYEKIFPYHRNWKELPPEELLRDYIRGSAYRAMLDSMLAALQFVTVKDLITTLKIIIDSFEKYDMMTLDEDQNTKQ